MAFVATTGSDALGSMRSTVLSAWFTTQTEPSAAATPVGAPPTSMLCANVFEPASIRATVFGPGTIVAGVQLAVRELERG